MMMMKIKWTKNNSKLNKNPLKTVGFGLQAGKTCPKAGACAKFCYAKQGAYTWSGVRASRQHNYECTQNDYFPAAAVLDLKRMKSVRAVRIHDSGDFYSQDYLDYWCLIAENHPTKVFYAYTKSLHLNFDHVPENMKIIQSEGGKLDHKIDRSKPHSRVFPSLEALEAAGYVNGSETDEAAYSGVVCIGLVYHGTKKMTDEMGIK